MDWLFWTSGSSEAKLVQGWDSTLAWFTFLKTFEDTVNPELTQHTHPALKNRRLPSTHLQDVYPGTLIRGGALDSVASRAAGLQVWRRRTT